MADLTLPPNDFPWFDADSDRRDFPAFFADQVLQWAYTRLILRYATTALRDADLAGLGAGDRAFAYIDALDCVTHWTGTVWTHKNAPFAMAAGSYSKTVTVAPANIVGPVWITFPVGRFTVTPIITFGTAGTKCVGLASSITAAGFNLYQRNIANTDSNPGDDNIYWTATQMTPTAAAG